MKKKIIMLVLFVFVLFFVSCTTNGKINEMKRIDEIPSRYNLKTIKKAHNKRNDKK